jgi:hypothetical protein
MAQAQITTVDLDEANERLLDVISEMRGTSDVAELQAIGKRLKKAAAEVQEMALGWRAQLRAAAGMDAGADDPDLDGISTVVLTERHRAMVYKETGLALTQIDLRGPVWPQTLPAVQPKIIDHAILAAAREQAAQTNAPSPAADRINEIRNGNDDKLKELLAKALDDPSFLGGALPD